MRRRYFIFRRRSSITVLLLLLVGANTGFTRFSRPQKVKTEPETEVTEKESLYDKLGLASLGLSRSAFDRAMSGFSKLKKENKIENGELLSIADMSRSANEKRLFVIDLVKGALLFHTYVSHGRNSGEEYARSFANTEGSFKSSLGFYRTSEVYNGKHGESLRLVGLEKGVNHHALERGIVVHGANYVSEEFIARNGRLGRSQGCPAVPEEECKPLVECIQGGSCFYIHYPDSGYFRHSILAEK